MNTDQVPLPDDTRLTEPIPLTPDEIERNQAIVEKLLGDVFGQDSERTKNGEHEKAD